MVLNGFDGKVALIPGGATRIGAAVAKLFVAAGARVAIGDIDEPGAKTAAAPLGDRALALRCDIGDDFSVAGFVAATVEKFGRIDFLVNVACVYLDQGATTAPADWLAALNVNLVGPVRMIQAARPHMMAAGGGAIVNIGSISGKIAQVGRWVYPASKAAVLQMTRSAALDLAREKIRVNSVSPGWTWSNVLDTLSGGDRALVDAIAAPFHMLGRAADPEEVAQAALFLCSDQARFITGADLAADGGSSALGPEGVAPAIETLLAARAQETT